MIVFSVSNKYYRKGIVNKQCTSILKIKTSRMLRTKVWFFESNILMIKINGIKQLPEFLETA